MYAHIHTHTYEKPHLQEIRTIPRDALGALMHKMPTSVDVWPLSFGHVPRLNLLKATLMHICIYACVYVYWLCHHDFFSLERMMRGPVSSILVRTDRQELHRFTACVDAYTTTLGTYSLCECHFGLRTLLWVQQTRVCLPSAHLLRWKTGCGSKQRVQKDEERCVCKQASNSS